MRNRVFVWSVVGCLGQIRHAVTIALSQTPIDDNQWPNVGSAVPMDQVYYNWRSTGMLQYLLKSALLAMGLIVYLAGSTNPAAAVPVGSFGAAAQGRCECRPQPVIHKAHGWHCRRRYGRGPPLPPRRLPYPQAIAPPSPRLRALPSADLLLRSELLLRSRILLRPTDPQSVRATIAGRKFRRRFYRRKLHRRGGFRRRGHRRRGGR